MDGLGLADRCSWFCSELALHVGGGAKIAHDVFARWIRVATMNATPQKTKTQCRVATAKLRAGPSALGFPPAFTPYVPPAKRKRPPSIEAEPITRSRSLSLHCLLAGHEVIETIHGAILHVKFPSQTLIPRDCVDLAGHGNRMCTKRVGI